MCAFVKSTVWHHLYFVSIHLVILIPCNDVIPNFDWIILQRVVTALFNEDALEYAEKYLGRIVKINTIEIK